MQENRSFDHYFGSMRGVRGFGDKHPARLPSGRSVWHQPDGDGFVLPFHPDAANLGMQYLVDLPHGWQDTQAALNRGKYDAWIPNKSRQTMAYLKRDDIPFHYALADAFTVCDHYFCSVLGPTIPNRLYLMAASLDEDGRHGGPEPNNIKYNLVKSGVIPPFSWTTYPERLQAAGIDWKVYVEADDYDDNVLKYFGAYQDPKSDLTRRARSAIAPNKTADKIRADVQAGNLPQVSWIVQNKANSEHPEATPAQGAAYIQGILDALTSAPKVWAKTALIITYDENGGFFDHVPPPTPPPGTPGEFLTPLGLAKSPEVSGIAGPIGLGFRVPTIVISPFSRGGYVASEIFDHTSTLRLLETRFGVEVPNLSAWRRQTVGDLTSAFNFGCVANPAVPDLPNAKELAAIAREQCMRLPKITGWQEQAMPKQETGTRPKPGTCAPNGLLPRTGSDLNLLPVGLAAGAVAASAYLRRRVASAP